MTASHFISIDWGTSRFRMLLVKVKDLSVVAELDNDEGIKSINEKWEHTNHNRLTYFLAFLRKRLQAFASLMSQNTPILISGMASSSIGMKDLPYATLPFSCSGEGLCVEEIRDVNISFPIYLISGVSSDTDVMRGEETSLIGLHNSSKDKLRVLYLLPGTHSKHIICHRGSIISFSTYMTGEMFDIIRKHTILKDSMEASEMHLPEEIAFEKGVLASGAGKLLHNLFKIRAGDLLHHNKKSENFYFLSGTLIGEELRNIANDRVDEVFLCGSEELSQLYQRAAEVLKISMKKISEQVLKKSVLNGHAKILLSTTINKGKLRR
ncbi:MAG: 2-dehydro-3-deoxygalactonokinase [Saprospiraceae bacterium]|nr:2-dehydro-3-deoxygalactonokinase [Saprospiraceae bacterium]